MIKEEKMKRCKGCALNYYNKGTNSLTGSCWNLDKAKPVLKKEVRISTKPPWKNQPIKKVYNCYHKRKYIYVEPDQLY